MNEIKKVARRDPALGAEAPRASRLATRDFWGDLCGRPSPPLGRPTGDRGVALSPDPQLRGFFHGDRVPSALFRRTPRDPRAAREGPVTFWPYHEWGACAGGARPPGRGDRVRRGLARAPHEPIAIAAACEEVLLAAGRVDEAYRRYALEATRGTSYLATYRALARKYPHKESEELLADLVETTPGDEGKWFATAKEVGLFDEAIRLATRAPCDPKTLTRAARDFADVRPEFAVEAGLAALRWLAEGYGYEITGADVWAAYTHTMKAAEKAGRAEEVRDRIRMLITRGTDGGGFVGRMLGQALGL